MKELTKTGEEFIRTICSGDGDSLISGKYKYNLPFSTITPSAVTFTANAIDHLGNPIMTNAQLGEALIAWYNEYAELTDIDANVLAAQGYAESKYRLWHYAKNTSGSGLANLISIKIFRKIVQTNKADSIEAASSPRFTDSEISAITFNIVDPEIESTYHYRGRGVSETVAQTAVNNRVQLHQNIIDNPAISIKAQANLMREISKRNNGITTNTLFAYSRGYLLSEKNYPQFLDKVGRKYGDNYAKQGIEYVDRIFRYLGDRDNNLVDKQLDKPKGIWFGYEIDFGVDNFNAFLG